MIQKKDSLYWSVYKNLERELIDLSRQIHFDDNQQTVYSVKIAELLVRCCIEIESITKDLYFLNGGTIPQNDDGKDRDLYFDTDCLELLENIWILSKKVVLVSASTFYFEREENLILTPLYKANKRGTSGADWKKAYQAVKHNRSQNLVQGNLKHVIKAMGALFILNVYYKDESFNVGNDFGKIHFDTSLGSNIFSLKTDYAAFNNSNGEVSLSEPSYSEAIYIKKLNDKSYIDVVTKGKLADERMKDELWNSVEFQNFIKNNPNYSLKGKHLMNVCQDVGGDDFMRKIMRHQQESINLHYRSDMEMVLNKHRDIYPSIQQ